MIYMASGDAIAFHKEVCAVDMRQLLQAEPYLSYLGLEVVEAQPGIAALRLPLRREVSNHIGTVHGGAQYGLGEATAIALAATLFPENIDHLNLLTANATIVHHRLAQGDLMAHAIISDYDRERIRTEFTERGRVGFPVTVEITGTSGNAPPATTLTVECAVRSRG